MTQKVKVAFEEGLLRLPLSQLLPTRQVKAATKKTVKYGQILASIREVGVIEPLIVYPATGKANGYLLLDGHLRMEALKDLGEADTLCIVSKDDESFTYNTHVNGVSAIQAHFMIVKALERGVSEERLAKALRVDVSKIRRQRDLLNGICPEAVSILKDRPIPPSSLHFLKRVRQLRQIEMAELMVVANNYSTPYARALLAATPRDQILAPEPAKPSKQLRPEDAARLDKEMKMLGRELKMIEQNYGRDMLNVVLARGFLIKLFDNVKVKTYLTAHHPELFQELEKASATKEGDLGPGEI